MKLSIILNTGIFTYKTDEQIVLRSTLNKKM